MNFLKQEVKNDEMVELARNNFSAPINQMERDVNKPDKFPSYELCLPFKSDVIDLSSNKELTWKWHKKMCERAQRNWFLDDYKAAFKELEKLEITEKIEAENENSNCLLHRPIVQNDSITTKIRPVFDALAHETDRFHSYPTGHSADIEKAFLQLGIAPKHRDFLRSDPDEGKEIVYRHGGVVFGVWSSSLLAAVLKHLLENVPAEDSQLGSKLKLSFNVDNCVTGVNDVAQQE
ncbi:DUF1758 domain-containing protein [Trichonephila clavata]|uniref:DUF1758 domain-containing protein n=1 Tax=Trichonephila clavata TaxID=2740835 RepID=A0A8X6HHH9_TRICU|nr:DUF1758 domain-containing protein [Trichonephila clavata]